jgi:hypothetical protein
MPGIADEALNANCKTPHRLYTRRLSDKLLIAFDQACDTGELEAAEQLLHILEELLTRPPNPLQDRRRHVENVVMGYQRLWVLKQIQSNARGRISNATEMHVWGLGEPDLPPESPT